MVCIVHPPQVLAMYSLSKHPQHTKGILLALSTIMRSYVRMSPGGKRYWLSIIKDDNLSTCDDILQARVEALEWH